MNRLNVQTIAALVLVGLCARNSMSVGQAAEPSAAELVVVVMDPLAAPLSCPCVKGYAQRDYKQLGKFLSQKLQRPVQVVFSESLAKSLKEQTDGRADIVIGKQSVVLHDAKATQRKLREIARLTDKQGQTVQTGMIVVAAADPAKTLADLAGYRIIFGGPEAEEKHGSALALLGRNGVKPTGKLETCASCSDGAALVVEKGPTAKMAAVISSYARPLLEGCGTIEKGDLRVLGVTEPVPFVTAFVSEALPEAEQRRVRESLLAVVERTDLLLALESVAGFVSIEEAEAAKKK
jgi:ABC-type phosphate/phosphonate transport system substrate-binding protein